MKKSNNLKKSFKVLHYMHHLNIENKQNIPPLKVISKPRWRSCSVEMQTRHHGWFLPVKSLRLKYISGSDSSPQYKTTKRDCGSRLIFIGVVIFWWRRWRQMWGYLSGVNRLTNSSSSSHGREWCFVPFCPLNMSLWQGVTVLEKHSSLIYHFCLKM